MERYKLSGEEIQSRFLKGNNWGRSAQSRFAIVAVARLKTGTGTLALVEFAGEHRVASGASARVETS